MTSNDAMTTNSSTAPNVLTGWQKQLGIAALYAASLYLAELFLKTNAFFGHFASPTGLALATLLIGGKRYAWGVFLIAVPIHATSGNSLPAAVISASADALQALCGAWLITRSGKFDLHLQSLRAYLRLIMLGGCVSVTLGTLVANLALLGSGLLAAWDTMQSMLSWWMGDMLSVVLAAPLVMVWWRADNDWRNTRQMIEAVMLIGLTIAVGQIVFLGWLGDGIGRVSKGYWMFILITLVAMRLGTRGITLALIVMAVQALLGAILGTGFFADDIAATHLFNYWFYMMILSIVGMTLATHLAELKQAERQLHDLSAHLQTVREEEMAGIAREIHDDLGSTLTAMKMKASQLKTVLSNHKAAPYLEHIESISQLINDASNITRRIITGLRPTILDDLGLLAALEWQAGQFQKFSGIECRVNCIGDKGGLDQPRSIALFRILQEALTNVMRHSGASSVEIEYHHSDEEVVLSVIDNGRGLTENRTVASIPYGILGMQERASQLGGTLNLDTPPGGGFSVTVILPLPANEK